MICCVRFFPLPALCSFASIALGPLPGSLRDFYDQLRFEQMLEDEQTISKAQIQINELSGGEVDAQAVNQMVRWVATKEDHATKIQETIAAYFMAQRIKADNPNYVKQLTAAHAVIVAAMKCKQSPIPQPPKCSKNRFSICIEPTRGKSPTSSTATKPVVSVGFSFGLIIARDRCHPGDGPSLIRDRLVAQMPLTVVSITNTASPAVMKRWRFSGPAKVTLAVHPRGTPMVSIRWPSALKTVTPCG